MQQEMSFFTAENEDPTSRREFRLKDRKKLCATVRVLRSADATH